jgi:hypothetical protein
MTTRTAQEMVTDEGSVPQIWTTKLLTKWLCAKLTTGSLKYNQRLRGTKSASTWCRNAFGSNRSSRVGAACTLGTGSSLVKQEPILLMDHPPDFVRWYFLLSLTLQASVKGMHFLVIRGGSRSHVARNKCHIAGKRWSCYLAWVIKHKAMNKNGGVHV